MARNQRGFTLIEMAVAIAILGLGLVTLVTLQTRSIGSYLHEENVMRASLFAQYIMTEYELRPQPPEEGSKEAALVKRLNDVGYWNRGGKAEQALKDSLKGWRVTERVTSVPIGPFEDALRRIDLVVSWGTAGNESFQLIYFLKGPAPRLAAGGGGT